ncbi:MAG: hypothetical protein V4616_12705 [Bacteroidota bacterium]
MRRSILVLLSCCALVFTGRSQTLPQLLKTAWQPFYTTGFDVTIDVKVYSGPLKLTTVYKSNTRYQKLGSDMLLTSAGVEQLINNQVMLHADKTDRLLMIGNQPEKTGAMPLISLDSLVGLSEEYLETSISAAMVTKDAKGNKCYSFTNPSPEFKKIELWFNSRQLLERMVLVAIAEGDNDPNPVIEYSFTHRPAPTDKSIFALSRFGALKNKKFTPSAAFRNYEIMVQL